MTGSGSSSRSRFPTDVTAELVRWGRRHLDGGRRLESFHVTLAFLGAQPRAALGADRRRLRREAAATEPFELEPVRYRETRSVGMLVLADPERTRRRRSRSASRRASSASACTSASAAPWLPHVTVLRFRERPRLDPPLPEIGAVRSVRAAALLSRLHPSGARYEVLESCPLGGRAAEERMRA